MKLSAIRMRSTTGSTKATGRAARRASASAVLLLATALALSGCGAANPAHAATVNGAVISTQQIQSVAREISVQTKAQQPIPPTQILAILIEGKFALAAQTAAGKGISTDDARRIVAEQLKWNDPSPEAVEFFRNVIAVEATANDPAEAKAVSIAAANAVIKVNPRYGTDFNAKTHEMVAEAPNWIAPVAVPAPAPSAPAPAPDPYAPPAPNN